MSSGSRRHHRKIPQSPPKSAFNQIASLFGVEPTSTPTLSTTSSSVLETLGSVFNFLSPAQTKKEPEYYNPNLDPVSHPVIKTLPAPDLSQVRTLLKI